jgi:hypothetical protein
MKDYYRILGVEPTAPLATIRKSWRRESFLWHPDRNPNRGADAHSRFLDLSEAWAVLSNPDERREYDLKFFGRDEPPIPPWAQDLQETDSSQPKTEKPAPPPKPAPQRPGREATESDLKLSLRQWRRTVHSLAEDLALSDRRGRRLDAFMSTLWICCFLLGLGGFGWFLWRLLTFEKTPGGYPLWSPLLLLLCALTVRVWGAAFRAHRIERYWPLAAEILDRAGHGFHSPKFRSSSTPSQQSQQL